MALFIMLSTRITGPLLFDDNTTSQYRYNLNIHHLIAIIQSADITLKKGQKVHSLLHHTHYEGITPMQRGTHESRFHQIRI